MPSALTLLHATLHEAGEHPESSDELASLGNHAMGSPNFLFLHDTYRLLIGIVCMTRPLASCS